MKKYAGVSEDGRSMWYKDVKDKDGKPTGERTTTTAHSEASDYLCGNAIPDLYGGLGTSGSFFGFGFGPISASTSTTRSAARSTTRGMPQR